MVLKDRMTCFVCCDDCVTSLYNKVLVVDKKKLCLVTGQIRKKKEQKSYTNKQTSLIKQENRGKTFFQKNRKKVLRLYKI